MRHGAGTQQLSQARVRTVLPKKDWHWRHEAIRGNQKQIEDCAPYERSPLAPQRFPPRGGASAPAACDERRLVAQLQTSMILEGLSPRVRLRKAGRPGEGQALWRRPGAAGRAALQKAARRGQRQFGRCMHAPPPHPSPHPLRASKAAGRTGRTSLSAPPA